jgi:GNAT superfamily N-acetyltransferase
MFANIELAARIDRAEARLCAGATAAIARRNSSAHTLELPLAGGAAVYATPGSPLNKVIGLGLEADFDPARFTSELAAIETAWHQRNESVRIEISTLANPEIYPILHERGYTLQGFENQLGRPLAEVPVPAAPERITVEELRPDDAATWMKIAVDAFLDLDGTGSVSDDPLSREILEAVLEDVAGAPGFTRYLARYDGRPAAIASMRLDGALAQLAGTGTSTPFRGKGLQKALIAYRLRAARAAGCDLAVVTTAPGTRSQENLMRNHFALLYARAVLIKTFAA